MGEVIKGNIIDAAVRETGGRAYKPLIGEPVVMGGFNRIYDTVGIQVTMNRSMRVLAAGGTLSVLGISKTLKLDMTPLWLKQQTIKGSFGYNLKKEGASLQPVFAMALDMIARGDVDVSDMLTHKFPLEDYISLIRVNLAKTKHRAVKTAFSFI